MMTETPWINGYGDGVSGPTSPATGGVTVHEFLQMKKFQELGKSEDYPYDYYTVISKGRKTIAIIPTLPENKEEGEANAKRIVDCVNAMEGIEDPISFMKSLRLKENELISQTKQDQLGLHLAHAKDILYETKSDRHVGTTASRLWHK